MVHLESFGFNFPNSFLVIVLNIPRLGNTHQVLLRIGDSQHFAESNICAWDILIFGSLELEVEYNVSKANFRFQYVEVEQLANVTSRSVVNKPASAMLNFRVRIYALVFTTTITKMLRAIMRRQEGASAMIPTMQIANTSGEIYGCGIQRRKRKTAIGDCGVESMDLIDIAQDHQFSLIQVRLQTPDHYFIKIS